MTFCIRTNQWLGRTVYHHLCNAIQSQSYWF